MSDLKLDGLQIQSFRTFKDLTIALVWSCLRSVAKRFVASCHTM